MSAPAARPDAPASRLPFLALLAARALQLLAAFVVSAAVVWRFGLPAAGTLALASLPSALCAFAMAFGMQNALPRLGAAQGERAAAGLVLSTLLVPPCAACCLAYGLAVGADGGESVAIAGLALAGGFAGMVNVQQTLHVLQGRWAWAPLAPALHLAGTGVALAAPGLDGFALALVATRALGCAAGFLPLAYARPAPGVLREAALSGSRFAPLDVAGLLADQLPVLVLSVLLTRAELGLFGLVRQFVAVAETPGWSYVSSRYPDLVQGVREIGRDVAFRNERISWAAGACVLALATAMASFVYRAPDLIPLLPAVILVLPARYLANFCDQSLRATGHVRDCLGLSALRVGLSLALFAALALRFGLWGAVAALALLSLASALLFRSRLQARFPGLLAQPRPWLLSGVRPA